VKQISVQERGQTAQSLAREGQISEALALVQAASSADRAALRELEISLLRACQDFDGLVTLRRQQVAEKPASVVAHHNLGSVLGDAGKQADAEASARKAIALGGNSPETWLVLARALQAQAKADEAIDAYRQVLSLKPHYVEAVNELAQQIWMTGGAVEAAREPFEQALKQFPASSPLLRALAVFNAYVGVDPNAVYDDLVARRTKAALRDAAVEVAASHLALDFDVERAMAHAVTATQIVPNDLPAWTAVAKCHLVSGQAEDAVAIMDQLVRVAGHDQATLAIHATAMRMAGRPNPTGLDDADGLIRGMTIDAPQGWDTLSDYLADLTKALEAQHSFSRHPIGQSLRHGSQTPVDLRRVDDPVIQAFFEAIDGPIRRHLAAMGTGSDAVRSRNTGDYRIVGCWSVRLQSGGFHEAHIHSNGWLSSACYIDLPTAVDRGGTEGWIGFGVPPYRMQTPLEPLKVEKPEPGKLVLFPSCMWHGTLPFEDERHRLTIAFDLIPV